MPKEAGRAALPGPDGRASPSGLQPEQVHHGAIVPTAFNRSKMHAAAGFMDETAVFHSLQSNPIQTNPILRGVESFFCYVPNGTSLVLYYKSPWLPFVRLCLYIFALHLFGILELYRFHRHEGFLHARCLRRDQ